MTLDGKCPDGPLASRWKHHKANNLKLVGPINRRKYKVIVVGSGLAGASAAATLAEQGYQVTCISFHDSPARSTPSQPRAVSTPARDIRTTTTAPFGCSTIRSKAATSVLPVSRTFTGWLRSLRTSSVKAVAQGVPFAREYGGTLSNRTFGGVLVSRAFYAAGQTGQQLLLGAYSSLMRQVDLGHVSMLTYKHARRGGRGWSRSRGDPS